jgi:pimeloyl-ACP methyl ester carboxylesterase
VVLPGRGYTTRMPLLYYATALLLDRGADVLCVDWAFEEGAPLDAVQGHAVAAATAAVAEARRAREYERLTLVGKSLGTLATAHLLTHEPSAAAARVLWLTPPLRWAPVREQVVATAARALLVVGDADPLSDRQVVDAYPGARHVVAGGDHSLGLPGDVVGSVEALRGVVAAMAAFLA